MNKLLYYLIFFGLIFSSCHTSKTAQHSVSAAPVVTGSPAAKMKTVDSFAIAKQQLSDLLYKPAVFTTFYGKAKADFNSPQASGNATVYIKIQRDSLILLSITGPLNIEGARVLVTNDSVKIINYIQNTVQISSIAHLQQITRLPFTFNDFQNIIIGKPSLHTNTPLNYEFKTDSIRITAADALIKYIFSFTKNDFNLGQTRLESVYGRSQIDANIFYNDYHLVNAMNFSTQRDIAVNGDSPMSLQLNFKEYNFNQPQTFLFRIPKNYSVRYD